MTTANTYDVIGIGTGGVGSAAMLHLASRGCRVLGLDRFPGGHDRGSSHGQTRIIRLAYFEHADYVPLLRRAYELWSQLEQHAGRQLYFPVGLLEVGPPDGVVVPGVLDAAQRHGLSLEHLDRIAMRERFPGFVLPDGCSAYLETNAGYLLVEECVLAHLAAARKLGAELRVGETVVDWQATANGVRVRTDKATYHAGKLVISAGAWSGKLLADLGIDLRVRRKHLHWYQTANDLYRADRGGPCFFFEMPDGYFYGFPQIDALGVKVAEHSGGTVIDDPLHDDKSVEPHDRSRVEAFLSRTMPGVTRQATRHDVCYYTMSPDEHFIVDRHPAHPHVSFVAGLSGHGFKFTSVLGEILADFATTGAISLPIEFLSNTRAGLRGARFFAASGSE